MRRSRSSSQRASPQKPVLIQDPHPRPTCRVLSIGERRSKSWLTIFCRHTSASLLIQENADRDVQTDLESFFDEIAPDDGKRYVHRTEGLDEMPAHIKTALSQTQLPVPIASGRMVLGTWRGIYLFEHRRAPHRREIVLQLLGE